MVVGCKNRNTMNKVIYILTALLLIVCASSCESAPKVEEGIVGEWQLTEMDAAPVSDATVVYIEFKADKSFDIYQKVGSVLRYRKYVGTYSVNGSILSGEYKDGEEWGSDYRVTLEAEGQVLVLTAVTLDGDGAVQEEGEVCRYIKASLSDEEKAAADVVTRSAEAFLPFL